MISIFYPIVDLQVLSAQGRDLQTVAGELRRAGVRLVQLRDKAGGPQDVLQAAKILSQSMGDGCLLVMNDRADLAVLAGFGGVHVGQGDLPVADARRVVGAARIVGVSTHNVQQVRSQQSMSENPDMGHPISGRDADYIAVGPVFRTATKRDAAPAVGLEGVRRARELTRKPLVAIGGITRENARSVIDAGADSVAVIGGLFAPGESVEKVARDFLEILR